MPLQANPSKDGLDVARGFPSVNTTAGDTDPVWSGPTGENQANRVFREQEPRTPNAGNCMPPLPPFKQGN